jgi:hypothetical protein
MADRQDGETSVMSRANGKGTIISDLFTADRSVSAGNFG